MGHPPHSTSINFAYLYAGSSCTVVTTITSVIARIVDNHRTPVVETITLSPTSVGGGTTAMGGEDYDT